MGDQSCRALLNPDNSIARNISYFCRYFKIKEYQQIKETKQKQDRPIRSGVERGGKKEKRGIERMVERGEKKKGVKRGEAKMFVLYVPQLTNM